MFFTHQLYATHIVGGEIMYRLLDAETNRYRITAQLFFDCENGTPQAIAADQQLFISMWDAETKEYLGDFSFGTFSQTRVTKSQDYACINGPKNVCITAYLYSTEQTINPGPSGVILSWQRCCRNSIIKNIIAPGSTGFSAWTTILPNIENSSPLFTDIPPIYVCVDAPLDITQDAFDFDGDSLAYKLVRPYQAGAIDPETRIRPSSEISSDRPPFNNIYWKAGYDDQNQIPGQPGLVYNETTGRITITPTETGQFVVGLMVEEWRDGQMIGVTRRDYQINVINCDFNILANYRVIGGDANNGIYSFGCEDTVRLRNLSYIKPGFTGKYFWDFGVPDLETDTLTTFTVDEVPEYTYPGNGDYTITLTVISDVCEDEYQYDVRIRSALPFDLGEDKVYCDNFEELLVTRDPDAPDILWNTGSKDYFITVRDTGTYIATVSYGECTYSDTVYLGKNEIPKFSIIDDTLFCEEEDIFVELEVNLTEQRDDIKYIWTTGSTDTNANVTITQPGIWSVQVYNGDCIRSDDVRVWVADSPEVDNAFYCNDFVHTAEIQQFDEATYVWSNGQSGTTATFNAPGLHWVELKQRHCVKRDEFIIENSVVEVDLGGDRHFCDEIDTLIDAGGIDGYIYKWNTGDMTQSISINQPGRYKVQVINPAGCSDSAYVIYSLSESPTLELGDDTTICANSPTDLVAPSGFTYLWSNGKQEQVNTVLSAGLFSVIITDSLGCTGTDTLEVIVDPEALPSELYIPNSFTPNDDGLNDIFPFSTPVLQPEYYIAIYNRWGEKLFDSRDSDTQNWDGYYKGKKVQQDALIYYVYYRGCDGKNRTRKGTVTPVY